jgi:hypothetical protein
MAIASISLELLLFGHGGRSKASILSKMRLRELAIESL